jgi:aminoacylase
MTATEHGSAAAVEKAYVATDLTAQEAESAIQSFCNLIAFPTVSATAPTDGSYTRCAAYLVEQLQSVACLDEVHVLPEAPEHSPVVVARWKGADETLPVILLNSHYDVVPADPADWTIDPFAALRKGGKVYGRGAQDMKCVYVTSLCSLFVKNASCSLYRHCIVPSFSSC